MFTFQYLCNDASVIIVLFPFLISIRWTTGWYKLIFNWSPLIHSQFEPSGFTYSEPYCGHNKRPIFWNMRFLIADVIWFEGVSAKITSKQFSEYGSWAITNNLPEPLKTKTSVKIPSSKPWFQVIVFCTLHKSKDSEFSNYRAIVIMKYISQTYSKFKRKYFERNSELSFITPY